MYRSCIFCSAALGSNDSIERFPVGRSLAFDVEKGRLWAVCPKCARWNLAPIEERWEAIEDAERLFRDTRLRAQSENIGLAKLRDGTRLVRIGQALPGELAAWRYGERMAVRGTRGLRALARRWESPLLTGGYWVGAGAYLLGAAAVATAAGAVALVGGGLVGMRYLSSQRRVVHLLPDPAHGGNAVAIRGADLEGVRITAPDDGLGIRLFVPYSAPLRQGGHQEWGRFSFTLRGQDAKSALARMMVYVNEWGAPRSRIEDSAQLVARAGSPDEYLHQVAASGPVLSTSTWHGGVPLGHNAALALEMALHEETERRALQGELVMLEAMWRQAEEIADIADRLPDVAAPEPPRLVPEG